MRLMDIGGMVRRPDYGDEGHAAWLRATLDVMLTSETARADWRQLLLDESGLALSDEEALEAVTTELQRLERHGIWLPCQHGPDG
jgi:hypothetical protein